MDLVYFISALLLGIGGSVHCIGMCGPLAMTIPFSAAHRYGRSAAIVTYYLSKALAYGLMGCIAGFIGKGFVLMNWQQTLSIIAGIFIIAWVVIPHIPLPAMQFAFHKQFGRIFKALQQQPKARYYVALGMLNGFLPCGMVYAALATATTTGNPLTGFFFMFLFGIGTSPALVTIALLQSNISVRFRKHFRNVSFFVTVALGLILILRGMDLGIPYLSPHMGADGNVKSCCSK